MDLRTAIIRAAAFSDGEEGSVTTHLHIVPPVFDEAQPICLVGDEGGEQTPLPHHPGFVVGFDGRTGVLIYLDPGIDVPHAAPQAAELKAVLGVLKKEPFRLTMVGANTLGVSGASGTHFTVPSANPTAFPALPLFPRQAVPAPAEVIALVRRVVHAVGKSPDRPELGLVHLTPWFTEATDTLRIARAQGGLVDAGYLVPRELFQNWPKGDQPVSIGVLEKVITLCVGEELRFSRLESDEKFFALDQHLPAYGYCVIAQTEPLQKAVQNATKASPHDLVEVQFAPSTDATAQTIKISGISLEGHVVCTNVIPVSGAVPEPVRLLLHGKLLNECLKVVEEDVLDLRFSAYNQPLCVQTPGYTEALWPLTLEENKKKEAAP